MADATQTTEDPSPDQSSIKTLPTKSSQFFWTTPPPIPSAFSTLLTTYSHIPSDAQEHHILQTRNTAYLKRPYPCLGRFRFLELDLSTHPLYTTKLLPLLTSPPESFTPPHTPVFLDVGTCLGQDLRKLVFDGVPSQRLYGSDLHWSFVEAGYELFHDGDSFGRDRWLVPGNVLATPKSGDGNESQDDALVRLDRGCDVVSISAVFHLFGLSDQEVIVDRVVRLLRPDPGQRKLVLGCQVGNVQGQAEAGRDGRTRFRHSMESWRALWDERLARDEIKALGVKGCEVGGSLELPERFSKVMKDVSGGAEGTSWLQKGSRWQVWWVWVQF